MLDTVDIRSTIRAVRRRLTGGLLLSLIVALYGTVRRLPRPVARAVGRAGGLVAALVLRADARRTAEQLRRLPAAARPTVARVFAHLGQCAADACTLPRRAADLDALVAVHGRDVLDARLAAERGTVWVSGHLGHWELPAAWAAAHGAEVHVIAAPVHYPAVDRWIRRLRRRHGMRVIHPGRRGLRRAARVLAHGGHVALLIDQRVRGRGTMVPFLGSTAWAPTGAARLARLAGVPIGLVRCWRDAGGGYHIRFGPVIDGVDDPDRVTAELTSLLERALLENPEQWVWMHERWRVGA